jgi:MFS superfamily sulfate permease-like transporter
VGIIFGVIMGVILSLFLLLRKALNPPRYFLGLDAHTGQVMPLRPGYTSQRIRNIVMYRFAGSLFFANCDVMEDEVERAITDETEAVFLDVSLIPSVDISAGDRMASLLTSITERGLNCYLVGISDVLSDQLASYEIGDIDVSYASTLQEALEASGVEPILVSPDRGVE